MDFELFRLQSLAQRFDKDLIARRNIDGVLQVCQLVRRWEVIDLEGEMVLYPRNIPTLVFSLTDNWSTNGTPVSWGYEPLYNKFRQIALDRRDEAFRELEEMNEKVRQSKDRDFKNRVEDAAYEACDVFKKTFNDINTANMDKTNDVRRKADRSKKWL